MTTDFVSDVTIPDGKQEQPGARSRRPGGCAITGSALDNKLHLAQRGRRSDGRVTISLPNTVPVSATVDLSVAFVAPAKPGKHISRWQLFAPDGAAFGTKALPAD